MNINFNKLPPHIRDPNPDIYKSDNFLVLDFETTSINHGDPYNDSNSIVFASWYRNSDVTYTGIFKSEFELGVLVQDCQNVDFIVAHNAKFELGWLVRCGLDLTKTVVWCTQIGDYVLGGNRYGGKKGTLTLEACLKRRGLEGKESLVSKMIKGGVPTEEIPKSWLKRYGNKDVSQTLKLFLLQREEIIKDGLLGVMYTRCLLTPVLTDIEPRGVHIDKERTTLVYNRLKCKQAELLKEYNDLIGNINPRSLKQKAEAIYNVLKFKPLLSWNGEPKLTRTGKLPTDSATLSKLKATTKKQKRFVELQREISKVEAALSKTLDKFFACVTETEDHILTASINQTITQTQRLSSTGKNYKAQFQNFPREYKPLVCARNEGWEIGDGDQSQLEFRVAAELGQDEQAIKDIKEGVDVHTVTASIIFKEDGWEILEKKSSKWEELRTTAKTRTFKPLYGGTSGTDLEREYYEYFRRHYEGISKTQQSWIDEVLRTKKLKTITGLTFFWPNARLTGTGFVIGTQQICNYPVQSFATADIVPIGLVYQWHLMKANNLKSFLVNTVHDSTVGEVHPKEKKIYEEIVKKSLVDYTIRYLKKVYDIDFKVPLNVDVKFSRNWNDTEDWRNKWLG